MHHRSKCCLNQNFKNCFSLFFIVMISILKSFFLITYLQSLNRCLTCIFYSFRICCCSFKSVFSIWKGKLFHFFHFSFVLLFNQNFYKRFLLTWRNLDTLHTSKITSIQSSLTFSIPPQVTLCSSIVVWSSWSLLVMLHWT